MGKNFREKEKDLSSDERLHLAVDASGIGFWDRNIKTGEIFYNEQWLKLFGLTTVGPLVTHTQWIARIHPEDRKIAFEAFENHLNGIAPNYISEYRLLRNDGVYLWILDSGHIIERDSDNKPVRICGTSMDITQGIYSRQKMLENENKYRSVFEHLTDAFCRFTLHGKIMEVNRNFCDLLEIKMQDTLTTDIKLFFNAQNLKYFKKNISRIMESQSVNFETELVTAKKKNIPVSISARLITAEGDGEIQALIRDVADRKNYENALLDEKQKFKALIEHSPNVIMRFGKNLKCQYASPNMLKIMGISSQRCIGKKLEDIFFPQTLVAFLEEKMKWVLKKNKEASVNFSFELPYELKYFEAVMVPETNHSNSVDSILLSTADVTQYKLSEEQLRTAKEKAEQADKLKSAFLANMSHEIRTPINGILGFANLMEIREFSREKQIQYLKIINNSGKLLLNLVNDIIDIAKIEAGEIHVEPSPVNLSDLFHDIYEFYQGEKNRRNKNHVDIKIQLPEKQIVIETDPFRLRQILINLISNSLKFTEEGHIEIGYVPEKTHTLFFVKDTGIGMTQEDSSLIFERFKQAGNASRKKEGTGLGLAISKGLVELLGGKIWLNSTPDVGSEFYFTLPVNHKEITTEVAEGTKIHSKTYNWKGKTILLVEDEEINYLYIRELIDNTGIKLRRVGTAEEAIKICSSKETIDLIMMDMRLPGINGFEATRIIKKLRTSIPVIAQTAYAMQNERKLCLDAGCDYYLTKPFDQNRLFNVLNKFLT